MQYDNNKDILFIHIPRTGGRSIQQIMIDSHPVVTANTPNFIHADYETGVNLERLKYGNDWRKAWKFAVVRNPYAIEVSKWKTRANLLKARIKRDITHFTFKHFIDKTIKFRNTDTGNVSNTTCNSTYPSCSCEFSNTASPYYIDTGGNTDCRAIIDAYNNETMGVDSGQVTKTFFNKGNLSIVKKGLRNGQIGFITTKTGVVVANTILFNENLQSEWATKVANIKGYTNTIPYVIGNTSVQKPDYREYYKDNGVANTEMIQLVANNYELDIDHLHYSWHMGPNTIPTAAWSTTIDVSSYPQYNFGMGGAGISPAEANAVIKNEGQISSSDFEAAVTSNNFLALHHNFIHQNSNKSNGYISII